MRDSVKPANLGEMMGEGFEHRTKLTLSDLPKLLGHKMPEITYDRVGRLRLHHSLEQRFGKDYVNMPHIQDLLEQHAQASKVQQAVLKNRKSQETR